MKFSAIKNHLRKFRVGIAGAGGLGSNCAVALTRTGIGSIVIADRDVIEPANLNRQYYFSDQIGMRKTDALKSNLLRINPDLEISAHYVLLDPHNTFSIFSDCDVIVEALDDAAMKEMLVTTVLTKMPGIPMVIGSGMAGWGNSDLLRCRKVDDFLYVCGDESSEASEENPPLAPRVCIVANMQADAVVGILMNKQ
jgi:sulfur carrier protein ThiS adenylyltransferase